jgi:hypothetical protein
VPRALLEAQGAASKQLGYPSRRPFSSREMAIEGTPGSIGLPLRVYVGRSVKPRANLRLPDPHQAFGRR